MDPFAKAVLVSDMLQKNSQSIVESERYVRKKIFCFYAFICLKERVGGKRRFTCYMPAVAGVRLEPEQVVSYLM